MSIQRIPLDCKHTVLSYLGTHNGIPAVSRSWRQTYEESYQFRLEEWKQRPENDIFHRAVVEHQISPRTLSPRDSYHRILKRIERRIQDNEALVSDELPFPAYNLEEVSYESANQFAEQIDEVRATNLIAFAKYLAEFTPEIDQFLRDLPLVLSERGMAGEIRAWMREHRNLLAQITHLPLFEGRDDIYLKIPPEFALLERLDLEQIKFAIREAFDKHYVEVLKAISESFRMSDLVGSSEGFIVAAITGHLGGLQVIQSRGFGNISEEDLSSIFYRAMVCGRSEVLNFFLESHSLHHISSRWFKSAVAITAARGHIDSFNALLQSPRVSELSSLDLQKALVLIFMCSKTKLIRFLNSFIKSPGLANISMADLCFGLRFLVISSDDKVLKVLLKSPKASGAALCVSAHFGDHRALETIVESPCFDRISQSDRKRALIAAQFSNQTKACQILKEAGVHISLMDVQDIAAFFITYRLKPQILGLTQTIKEKAKSSAVKTAAVAALIGVAYWGWQRQ